MFKGNQKIGNMLTWENRTPQLCFGKDHSVHSQGEVYIIYGYCSHAQLIQVNFCVHIIHEKQNGEKQEEKEQKESKGGNRLYAHVWRLKCVVQAMVTELALSESKPM